MATQYGHYINDADIDNWNGESDAEKLVYIQRSEGIVEHICRDYFRPVDFDIRMDGNGQNRLSLRVEPNIIYVGNIDISNIALNSDWWAWDEESVYLDTSLGGGTSVELRMRLRPTGYGLFPTGINNIRIRGEYGMPERLDYDNPSGDFERLETITGGTSTATAVILEIFPTYFLIVNRSTTDFDNDEEITGGTSEETADVNNANGAINDAPKDIQEAVVILVQRDLDPTRYTFYQKGSEAHGAYSYQSDLEPLTNIAEADVLLRRWINHKAMMGVV